MLSYLLTQSHLVTNYMAHYCLHFVLKSILIFLEWWSVFVLRNVLIQWFSNYSGTCEVVEKSMHIWCAPTETRHRDT